MAKAKKSASADKSAQPQKAAPAPAAPAIDASAAAEVVARMIANRDLLKKPQAAVGGKKASDEFKQAREAATKPHIQGMGDALREIGPDTPAQQNLPGGNQKQVGHSQTTGGFNRTGVPRRTAG